MGGSQLISMHTIGIYLHKTEPGRHLLVQSQRWKYQINV